MHIETVFLYSDNDGRDHKKIIIPIRLLDQTLEIDSDIKIKVDTGAGAVILNAKSLGIDMTEEEFSAKFKIKPEKHRGIANNIFIDYYRYIIDRIIIGNTVFNNFPIRVSFNNNAKSALLGMDALRFFNTVIKPEYREIVFIETEELRGGGYTDNKKSMHNIDKVIPETYIDLTDEQAVEAYYINRLIEKQNNKH